jgi:hypothetical protein
VSAPEGTFPSTDETVISNINPKFWLISVIDAFPATFEFDSFVPYADPTPTRT